LTIYESESPYIAEHILSDLCTFLRENFVINIIGRSVA